MENDLLIPTIFVLSAFGVILFYIEKITKRLDKNDDNIANLKAKIDANRFEIRIESDKVFKLERQIKLKKNKKPKTPKSDIQ